MKTRKRGREKVGYMGNHGPAELFFSRPKCSPGEGERKRGFEKLESGEGEKNEGMASH